MPQSGQTPIQLYRSTTAAAAPTAGNLTDGELAINQTDGKLYYKDNAGVVKLLASNAVAAIPASGIATSTGTAWGAPITNSAGLAAALSDKTGTGAAVFANSPTLVTPALGTPSSGVVTNLTGTASININGTVGATSPAAGTFTTLTATTSTQTVDLTATGSTTLGDAAATDVHAINGRTSLLANSASAALTVTQTGAGNAFVVEDSASDTTIFGVNPGGQVFVGHTSQPFFISGIVPQVASIGTNNTGGQLATVMYSADASPTWLHLGKSRGAIGSQGVVSSGDGIANIDFSASDGTIFTSAARISAQVDGTPGTNDMPGRLVFSTTADGASSPTERMRIDSAGNVGFGVTPVYPVDVQANASAQAVRIRGRASDNLAQLQFVNNGASAAYGYLQSGPTYVSTYVNGAESIRANQTNVQILPATAIPAGGTTGVGVLASSTANFGVFFGSGAPTLSAAKGSLYLRSDGSTTNDRMYVNTNGSTTWTAVITAA